MTDIDKLKEEHVEISAVLDEIERNINEENSSASFYTPLLEKLKEVWDKHERKEEKMFFMGKENPKVFPTETMLLDQHKQLRGHWKVLKDTLANKDDILNIIVALDTDGRMLIQKFRKHFQMEEEFFDKLIITPVNIKSTRDSRALDAQGTKS